MNFKIGGHFYIPEDNVRCKYLLKVLYEKH